jgi:hypothetical protein
MCKYMYISSGAIGVFGFIPTRLLFSCLYLTSNLHYEKFSTNIYDTFGVSLVRRLNTGGLYKAS